MDKLRIIKFLSTVVVMLFGVFYIFSNDALANEGSDVNLNSFGYNLFYSTDRTNLIDYLNNDNMYPFRLSLRNEVAQKDKGEKGTKLTFYKTNRAGEPLVRAKFEVYNADHSVKKIVTTNAQGIGFIPFLPPGEYFYKEIMAPKGYLLVDEEVRFTMTSKPKQISIINDRAGTFTLTKIGESENVLLGLAKFELTYPSGKKELLETGIGGPNKGKIILEDLPYGQYHIRETTPPTGYQLGRNTEFSFTINKDQLDHTWTVKNDPISTKPKTGEFTLYKMESATGKPLAGASFKIEFPNGQSQIAETAIDPADGKAKIHLTNLAFGEYKVTEQQPPEGYTYDGDSSFRFTINAKNLREKEYVKNKKIKTGVITLMKYGETSTTLLNDAEFEITYPNGTKETVLTGEQDEQGKYVIKNAVLGTYTFKEVNPPAGYELGDDVEKTITLTKSNLYRVVEFTNFPAEEPPVNGTFALTKTGETEETLLGGAAFELTYPDGTKETFVTGLEGETKGKIILTDLELGDYSIKETGAPLGYVLDENAEMAFTISEETTSVEWTVQNIPVEEPPVNGTFVLTKTGETEETLLGGATFELTYPDGTKETFVTGLEGETKGKIILTDLELGDYSIKETEAPLGYVLDENAEMAFTISKENPNVEWSVTNNRMIEETGSIHFVKMETGNDEHLLSGAVFEVYRVTEDGDQLVATVTTVDGLAEVSNLPYGEYYYKETQAPTSYIGTNEQVPFTISAEKLTLTAKVYNTKIETPACTQFVMKNLPLGKRLKVNGEIMTVPETGQLTFSVGELVNGVYVVDVFNENGQLFVKVKVTEDCVVSFEVEKKCELVIDTVNWLPAESTTTYVVEFEEGAHISEGDAVFVNGQPATIELDANGKFTVDVLQEGPITRYKPKPIARVASLFASLETVKVGVGNVTNTNGQVQFSFDKSIGEGDQVFVADMLYMVVKNGERGLYLDGFKGASVAAMYQYEIVPEAVAPLKISTPKLATTSDDSGSVELEQPELPNNSEPEPEQPVAPPELPSSLEPEQPVAPPELPSNSQPQPQPEIEQEKEIIGYVTVNVTDGVAIASGDTVTIENVGSFTVNGQQSLDEKALNEASLYEGTFELKLGDRVVGTVRLVEKCTVNPPVIDPPDPVEPTTPPEPPKPTPPDDDDDDRGGRGGGGGGGSSITPPVITPPNPVDPPEEEESPVDVESPPTDTEEEFEVETLPANTPPPVDEEEPSADVEEDSEVEIPPATVQPPKVTRTITTRTITVARPTSNVYSSAPRLPQTDGAASQLYVLGYVLLATMFSLIVIRRRRRRGE